MRNRFIDYIISDILVASVSDHFMLINAVVVDANVDEFSKPSRTRVTNDVNMNRFSEKIYEIDWTDTVNADVNDCYNSFCNVVGKLYECLPLAVTRTKQCTPCKPWIT